MCECSEEGLIEDLCCFPDTLGKCTIFEKLTYTTPSVSSVSYVVPLLFVLHSLARFLSNCLHALLAVFLDLM